MQERPNRRQVERPRKRTGHGYSSSLSVYLGAFTLTLTISGPNLLSHWPPPSEEASPETVFHYTDGAALLGILKEKELWCTHIAYLNDSKEWIHSGDLIHKALASIQEDSSSTDRAKEYVEVAFRQISYDGSGGSLPFEPLVGPDQEIPGIFVASFSRRDDDLGMWRGYSTRNARYSIGLRTEALRSIEGWNFQPAFYDEDRLLHYVRSILLEGFKSSEESTRMHDENNELHPAWHSEPSALRWFIDRIRQQIGPVAKHPKFSVEGEWRLWSRGGGEGPGHFRSGESLLIPYVEVLLNPSAFVSVTVGPTSQPLLSERSLEEFLSSTDLSHVEVIRSGIPYRS